jgi:hypothetical protein
MATKANTSSVDTKDGDKMASLAKQKINAMRAGYTPEEKSVDEQVVNARKAKHLDSAKAKARRKTKLANASRKKNKK